MNSLVSGEEQVSVSFADGPNATRPFFDPISMTEVREKSLPSISLFRFDTEGSLTVRRKSESGTILATTTTASWSRRPDLSDRM